MPFEFINLNIPDVILVKPKVFRDERGFFMETYKSSDFIKAGITQQFVQDNHSKSTKGTLRGLHYQLNPKAQAKLVRCASGEIFDVAVDIRKGSPTFGKWAGAKLSAENKEMLFIPEGFAHGFLVLSDTAEVLYKAGNIYSPEHDAGILWNDPEIAIDWDIDNPILSEKDQNHPLLKNSRNNFVYSKSLIY